MVRFRFRVRALDKARSTASVRLGIGLKLG